MTPSITFSLDSLGIVVLIAGLFLGCLEFASLSRKID